MTTTATATIRAFLALPNTALPGAVYVGDPGILSPWSALRVAVATADPEGLKELLSGQVRLRADRDGWRDGVTVTL